MVFVKTKINGGNSPFPEFSCLKIKIKQDLDQCLKKLIYYKQSGKD